MTEFTRSYKMFTVVHPLGYRAIFIPRTSTTDLSNSTYLLQSFSGGRSADSMGVVMISVLRAEIHLVNIIKIRFDVQRIKIALSEVDK